MACFNPDGTPYPRFKPPPRPPCAITHNDPATWITNGTDNRGLDRLICQHCRRFIGYRMPERSAKKLTNEPNQPYD